MAYTYSVIKHNAGDTRMHVIDVTADAAAGVIVTGLSYIEGVSLGPVSCATNGFSIKPNAGTASAVANGSILIGSAAANDRFFLTVFGRG